MHQSAAVWRHIEPHQMEIGLPAGAILITSGATPSGWSEWGASEDRLIMGTDANATTTGGTNGSWSISTDTGTSNHNNSSSSYKHHYRTSGGSWTRKQNPSNAGGHTHSFTISRTVAKNKRRFIKNNTNGAPVPKGADVFSDTGSLGEYDGSSSANVGDGYFLTINAGSIGTSATGSSIGGSTGNAGSAHTHFSKTDGNAGSGSTSSLRPETAGVGTIVPSSGGGHTHSVSGSFTVSHKRAILRAWTRAQTHPNIHNRTIVMFEGATPEGWQTCNGANGTIDLRGYFICLSTGSVGTRSGSNTISASISIAKGGSHAHQLNKGSTLQTAANYGHHQSASHYHNASLSNRTWEPPHRKIKFIQRIE